MPKFEHIRHKPPQELIAARPLVLVSAPLRSSVNLSRMLRLAGNCGVRRLIHCGAGKIDREIARDLARQAGDCFEVVYVSTPAEGCAQRVRERVAARPGGDREPGRLVRSPAARRQRRPDL